MKPSTNISDIRRFMGMTNQLGKFIKNLAELTQPLRQLLTKKSTWLWGPEKDKAFSKIKATIMKPTVVVLNKPETRTKVIADASSYGLGAVLLQQQESDWKLIAFASRTMTETESRYAQIAGGAGNHMGL